MGEFKSGSQDDGGFEPNIRTVTGYYTFFQKKKKFLRLTRPDYQIRNASIWGLAWFDLGVLMGWASLSLIPDPPASGLTWNIIWARLVFVKYLGKEWNLWSGNCRHFPVKLFRGFWMVGGPTVMHGLSEHYLLKGSDGAWSLVFPLFQPWTLQGQ